MFKVLKRKIAKIVRGKRNNTSSLPEGFTGASVLLENGYGHKKSRETKTAVSNNGEALPWFTYSSIEYLNQFNFSDKNMLEWGAGNSSIYFSKKVKTLFSIESDKEWYQKISQNKIHNQELYLANNDYAEKASGLDRKFDMILIDGILREECAQVAIKILAPKGFVILDNSDRYPEISKMLREKEYIQVDFHGFGPINNYTWTTSIFLDRAVDLVPISRQPIIPIGGGF